jgi:undecaprenyl diphosphate synthase
VSSYLHDLDLARIPGHVAIVMDGNGRWAQQRDLPRTEGHGAGEEALWDTVQGAVQVGLPWLTVFAFSTENWRRPPGEVRYLMNFNRSLLRRRRDELDRMNVRIRFIGRRNWRVPRSVLKEIREAEALTAANTGTTFTIAFNYGGRAEVVDAVKELAREVRTEHLFEAIRDFQKRSRRFGGLADEP